MALKVVCDECGKEYQIDSAHAGKKARCKECGATMQIPSRSEERSSTPESRTRPKMKRPPEDEYEDYDVDQDEEEDFQPSRRRSASPARKRVSRGTTRTAGWGAGYSVGLSFWLYLIGFFWVVLTLGVASVAISELPNQSAIGFVIAAAITGSWFTPHRACWYVSRCVIGLMFCSSILKDIFTIGAMIVNGIVSSYLMGRVFGGIMCSLIVWCVFRELGSDRSRRFYGAT